MDKLIKEYWCGMCRVWTEDFSGHGHGMAQPLIERYKQSMNKLIKEVDWKWEIENKLYSLIHDDTKCLKDDCNWDKVLKLLRSHFLPKEEVQILIETTLTTKNNELKAFKEELVEKIRNMTDEIYYRREDEQEKHKYVKVSDLMELIKKL